LVKVFFKEIRIATKKRLELVNITAEVEIELRNSGIRNGICLIYAPHATVAIIANEHEYRLMQDIVNAVEKSYPRGVGWLHDGIDDNASAHLASAFIGSSRTFPVKEGELIRGTWQDIFLLELDGPRSTRRVVIEIMGE
jgi:secondary thiamine-phosphate synthase enzyme